MQRYEATKLVNAAVAHPAQFSEDTPESGGLVDVDSA